MQKRAIKKGRFIMYRKGFGRLLGKKGESLVLVIAVMFFFIIICLSISAAALASSRGVHAQTENNRIKVIENSIHKNIMYSLQTDDNMLGRQLARAFYDSGGVLSDITLDVDIGGFDINDYFGNINQRFTVESIRLSFPNIEVTKYLPIAALYEIEEFEIECMRKYVCILIEDCDESEPGCDFVCIFHPPASCTPCPQDCHLADHDCELGVCVNDHCDDFNAHFCDAACVPNCPYEDHVCSVGNGADDCVDPCGDADHDCILPGSCVLQCDIVHHDCFFDVCDEEWRSYHECEFVGYSPRAFEINPGCNYSSLPADNCAVACDRCYNPAFPHNCSGSDEEGKFSDTVKQFTFTTPRTPGTYSIFATMIVTVEISVGVGPHSRLITSQATYSYAGGELSDCMRHLRPTALRPDSYTLFECEGALPPPPGEKKLPPGRIAHCCMKMGSFNTIDIYHNPVMSFVDFGTWRLEKYENIESPG
jgi:hypothetical protein